MIKKLIYICAVMVGSLSGLSSCSLDIPPSDQYSDPDAIVDISTARSLLSSVYSLYPHYEYELSITTLAESLWGEYYNTIASCNALLERVDNITLENASEEKDKAAIISEAKALKALCYFNLLRLFAPAYDKNPQADGIVLKDELGLAFPKRSSIETCTTTIRTLLTEAAAVENNPDKNCMPDSMGKPQLMRRRCWKKRRMICSRRMVTEDFGKRLPAKSVYSLFIHRRVFMQVFSLMRRTVITLH